MTKNTFNTAGVQNGILRQAVRRCEGIERIAAIVCGFQAPAEIDPDIIPYAAEFGAVEALHVLVPKIPVAVAQDFYDRALVAAAVNDFAAPQDYVAVTRVLLKAGANPEAYDAVCRQMAGASAAKKELHGMLCAAIDRREEKRMEKAVAAFKAARR